MEEARDKAAKAKKIAIVGIVGTMIAVVIATIGWTLASYFGI